MTIKGLSKVKPGQSVKLVLTYPVKGGVRHFGIKGILVDKLHRITHHMMIAVVTRDGRVEVLDIQEYIKRSNTTPVEISNTRLPKGYRDKILQELKKSRSVAKERAENINHKMLHPKDDSHTITGDFTIYKDGMTVEFNWGVNYLFDTTEELTEYIARRYKDIYDNAGTMDGVMFKVICNLLGNPDLKVELTIKDILDDSKYMRLLGFVNQLNREVKILKMGYDNDNKEGVILHDN